MLAASLFGYSIRFSQFGFLGFVSYFADYFHSNLFSIYSIFVALLILFFDIY